jgi:hypothetical protein
MKAFPNIFLRTKFDIYVFISIDSVLENIRECFHGFILD